MEKSDRQFLIELADDFAYRGARHSAERLRKVAESIAFTNNGSSEPEQRYLLVYSSPPMPTPGEL